MDKRYDHLTAEQKMQALWHEHNTYAYRPSADPSNTFSIDTPPPTVSGTLHIGHVFSYTHTDMVARYKRLRGMDVFYPMGFDDNGLPTEKFVEKKHKTKAHLLKRSEFIELCLSESHEIEKTFEALWRRLGLSIDWSQTYSTISMQARKVSQRSFLELYAKNLVFRQEEPALYCTTCRTTVAQAELDSAEQSTTFNDITFKASDGSNLTIATTRPELLPACVAVFYHPDDTRYSSLAGTKATSPIFNHEVPLLADDEVDPDKGTGLVMCCTFGDQQDIRWYKNHDLPLKIIIGNDGTWNKNTGMLAGMRAHEARKAIIAELEAQAMLVGQKKISHAVNVHERCKQGIEYLVLRQWFVNILDDKQKFLERAEEINWYPSYMKSRYRDWVENLSWNWCISRQRYYGIPFPVWHCKDCSAILLARPEDLPIDPQEDEYPGKTCPECSSEHISGDTDIMDTWNTSSLSPQLNSGWPDDQKISMPMSMRPQAHDIIRTWAFYTIIKSHYHHHSTPWNDIVISGHVLAGKEKISKSKGGAALTPERLLSDYSADAIRYWTASSTLGTDTAFSENQLKIGNKLLTKMWNAYRFMSEHVKAYEKSDTTPKLDTLNQWLLDRFSATTAQYIKSFDAYEYHHALQAVESFFWQTFCDNYLELIKDQIFNPDNYDEHTIAATRFTLYEVGLGMLQLFGPFVPHITEALFQDLFKEKEGHETIHTLVLDNARYEYSCEKSVQTMKQVLNIIDQVRKLKSEKQLSLKTPLSSLTIAIEDHVMRDALQEQTQLIAGITKSENVSLVDSTSESSLEQQNDSWICVVKA